MAAIQREYKIFLTQSANMQLRAEDYVDYPALERLAQLAKNLDALQHRMSKQVDSLRRHPVETTNDSGSVRVLVNGSGEVERIEITESGIRLGATRLGEEITETVRRGQTRAAVQLRESIREALGDNAEVREALEDL